MDTLSRLMLVLLLSLAVISVGTLALSVPLEKSSPVGIFTLDNIQKTAEGFVILKLPDLKIALVGATNSMDPVIDENDFVIVVDAAKETIHVGDIIVSQKLVVHRVTESGFDNDGFFIRTQGDNNAFGDGVLREKDIKWLVVGILYGDKSVSNQG